MTGRRISLQTPASGSIAPLVRKGWGALHPQSTKNQGRGSCSSEVLLLTGIANAFVAVHGKCMCSPGDLPGTQPAFVFFLTANSQLACGSPLQGDLLNCLHGASAAKLRFEKMDQKVLKNSMFEGFISKF